MKHLLIALSCLISNAFAIDLGDYSLLKWDGTKFVTETRPTFPPASHNQAWSTITSTPTTLSGYGITDAQPLDSDLTTLAGVTSGAFGRNLLTSATADQGRSWLSLGGGDWPLFASLTIQDPANDYPVFAIGSAYGSVNFSIENITGSRVLSFPDASGTLLLSDGDGSALTALNASSIASGSLALARIAQGSATSGQALVWNGTAWAPGSVTSPVTSVAGRTGAITLSTSDISGLGTIATQAANSVAITGGSITGLTELLSSDPDFAVDTHGNVTSKYWKIRNDISHGVTLEMSVVSGAVPSTPGSFVSVARVSSGIVYISPGGSGIVLGGTIYLNNNLQSPLISDGDRMMQLGNDSSTPGDAVFHGPDGSGTNITGGKTIIRGGNGTGTGGSGAWELQTSPIGSSGSTANTPRATLRGNKDGTIDSPTMPVEASSDTATHKLTFYVNGVRYKLLAIQE